MARLPQALLYLEDDVGVEPAPLRGPDRGAEPAAPVAGALAALTLSGLSQHHTASVYPLRPAALPYSSRRRKSSVRQVSTAIPQKNSHMTPSKVGTHAPDDHSANAPK